ncbi:MAG: hypothetical protein OEW39_08340 [Deltaproteobacteria bacterium]|nr:hypothetical protein [Deltaproteobacteria bacterium]
MIPLRFPHQGFARCGLPRNIFLSAVLASVLLSTSWTAARAQQPLAPAPAQSAPELATGYDLEAVRLVLRAYHGFTQEGLLAASTQVPRALRELADSSAEDLLVRRQAIKALGLFPDPENFAFVSARLNAANVGLKRLYVAALGPYAPTRGAEVTALLAAPIQDRDALVRTYAAKVAGRVPLSTGLQGLVNTRLQVEADSGVREALFKALKR